MQTAFDEIQADDALLDQTRRYLRAKREKQGESGSRFPALRRAVALAATLAVALGLFSYTMVFSAAAYVSIDVNPSVELTLNRMNRVIDTQSFNQEGAALLDAANVKGLPYNDAAALLLANVDDQGYIREDTLVSVTVQTADGKREQALQDTLTQVLNTAEGAADVEVFPVSAELRGKAQACHMSSAKYLAIQELLEVDETATIEQYSESGIRQIRRRTQHCRNMQNDTSGSGEHEAATDDDATQKTDDVGSEHGDGNGAQKRSRKRNGHGGGHGHD